MPESFSLTVVRPEDMAVFRVEFREVGFTPPDTTGPGKITGGPGAHVIVHFLPQHVAEQAFYETAGAVKQTEEARQAGDPPPPASGEPPAPPGAVKSRLAGPTRLVFALPPGHEVPCTLEALLGALPGLPLSVTPVSAWTPLQTGCTPLDRLTARLGLPRPPRIEPPGETHTAIEAPYGLVLSPDGFATWLHQALPVEHGGRTELWHTRLGQRPEGTPRVRAVWSPDFREDGLQPHYHPSNLFFPDDFRSSLDARDRNELVHLTSNFSLAGEAVEAERLMLSPLGAWLRVQGDWDPEGLKVGSDALTVQQWRHDAVMGRDQYVRVVYSGFLMPFGHRASLVEVTERRLEPQPQGEGFVAHLFQRMYVVVREPTRAYAHRSLPFESVTLHTRVTPGLADPAKGEVLAGAGQSAFWPRIADGQGSSIDFLFHLSAIDRAGRVVEFTAPLVFVDAGVAADTTKLELAIAGYHKQAETDTPSPRTRDLAGQPIAFAPQAKPGDTSLETALLTFRAELAEGEVPAFLPAMQSAKVSIPAVKQLTGSSEPSRIVWEDTYRKAAGAEIGNLGQVFARVQANGAAAKPRLNFGTADKAGGLATPNLDITGLSRSLGPTGGPVEKMVAGTFEPADVFPKVTLLGAIDLKSIIKPMIHYQPGTAGDRVPGLTTAVEGKEVVTRYRWTLQSGGLAAAFAKSAEDAPVGDPLFEPRADATFSLSSTLRRTLDGGGSSRVIDGELTSFMVRLLPDPTLVEIEFESLKFLAVDGRKPDVAVRLRGIRFAGPLEFVNNLQQYIPLAGFDDPPNLEVVPLPHPGLNVGFTLGIPTMGVGVMTMQNVSLTAGFFLPFATGEMNFRFAFCERHQPFILTVSGLGGGGFFGIDVGLSGVVRVEAALEFGASVALNLGVAAGHATVMGGFYFQKAGGAPLLLTAYVRASGALSVLGIVTVCVEFYLGLSYQPKPAGRMWGQASLTVKVKICFFSKSVSVSMEREFAGSDPTFRTLMPQGAWAEYCDAFAAYPAS